MEVEKGRRACLGECVWNQIVMRNNDSKEGLSKVSKSKHMLNAGPAKGGSCELPPGPDGAALSGVTGIGTEDVGTATDVERRVRLQSICSTSARLFDMHNHVYPAGTQQGPQRGDHGVRHPFVQRYRYTGNTSKVILGSVSVLAGSRFALLRPRSWVEGGPRAPACRGSSDRREIGGNTAIPAVLYSLLNAQALQQAQPGGSEYLQAVGQPDPIVDALQLQGRARSLRNADEE